MMKWCKEGVYSLDLAAFSGVYCDSSVVPEILECKTKLDHVPARDFKDARVRTTAHHCLVFLCLRVNITLMDFFGRRSCTFPVL
jgi:hypothetical protein